MKMFKYLLPLMCILFFQSVAFAKKLLPLKVEFCEYKVFDRTNLNDILKSLGHIEGHRLGFFALTKKLNTDLIDYENIEKGQSLKVPFLTFYEWDNKTNFKSCLEYLKQDIKEGFIVKAVHGEIVQTASSLFLRPGISYTTYLKLQKNYVEKREVPKLVIKKKEVISKEINKLSIRLSYIFQTIEGTSSVTNAKSQLVSEGQNELNIKRSIKVSPFIHFIDTLDITNANFKESAADTKKLTHRNFSYLNYGLGLKLQRSRGSSLSLLVIYGESLIYKADTASSYRLITDQSLKLKLNISYPLWIGEQSLTKISIDAIHVGKGRDNLIKFSGGESLAVGFNHTFTLDDNEFEARVHYEHSSYESEARKFTDRRVSVGLAFIYRY